MSPETAPAPAAAPPTPTPADPKLDTDTPKPEPPPVAPSWTPAANACGGHPRLDVAAMVVRCIEPVRGKLPNPARCGTDAKPILALWRCLGRPPPEEFAADFRTVAEWAALSPHPAAARDIRAEGWAEGQDRSRDVTTLARQDRWQSRLDAARAWEANGRTSTKPVTATGVPMTKNEQKQAATRDQLRAFLQENINGNPARNRDSTDLPPDDVWSRKAAK